MGICYMLAAEVLGFSLVLTVRSSGKVTFYKEFALPCNPAITVLKRRGGLHFSGHTCHIHCPLHRGARCSKQPERRRGCCRMHLLKVSDDSARSFADACET